MKKAKLILEVTYADDPSDKKVRGILEYAADFLADEGLLSDDDGELDLTEWTSSVKIFDDEEELEDYE